MSTPDIGQIGLVVTEAQAVLELVAEKLSADKPLESDEAFRLFVAVSAAVQRLDSVHDILQEAVEPEPIVIITVETLQLARRPSPRKPRSLCAPLLPCAVSAFIARTPTTAWCVCSPSGQRAEPTC